MADPMPPTGFIHALLLDGRGGCREFPWEKVDTWKPEDGCLWLHFNYSDQQVQTWLEQHSGLNDIACAALVSDETRPRVLNRGDNLLLTLRGINHNAGENPEDMVSLRIWTNGSKVISTRRRSLLSTRDILDDLTHDGGPRNAVQLLIAWADRVVYRMNDTIDKFESLLESIENNLLLGETQGIRLQLAELRKQTVAVRRYLSPQREALNRLIGINLSWMDELSRLRFREVNDSLIRHIEDIDEIRDRAVLAQDELLSHISEQMNQRSYIFTAVAAIFLPLGFITGLMGINVGGMPGLESDLGFWAVALICVGMSIGLVAWFRNKRWL